MQMNVLLRTLRKEAHLKQYQIAEPLNLSRQAYSNYERGLVSPTIETLEKIAGVYSMRLDELIRLMYLYDSPPGGSVKLLPDDLSLRPRYFEVMIDTIPEFKQYMAKDHNRIRLASLTSEEIQSLFMMSIVKDDARDLISAYLSLSAARKGLLPADYIVRLPAF